MKLLLTFLAVAAVAHANDVDPDVEVLTNGNFASFIKEGTTLVEFYAPWCGHCKKLTPEFGKAATTLKKFGVRLGKVDATVETDLAGRFDISGYPTLKIFRDGEFSAAYEGPRDAAGIVAYMKKQSGPAARPFKSLEEVKAEAANIAGAMIAGVFKGDGDSDLAKAFARAAAKERDSFNFAVITGADEEKIVRIFPTSLPRFQGETEELTYTGDATTDAVANWLFSAALPVAGVSDAETAAIYDRVSKPVVTVYVSRVDPVNDASGTKYFLNRIRKVAKANTGLVFNLAPYTSAPFEIVTGAGYNIGIRGEGGEKFRFNTPSKKFAKEDLESFVAAYLAGDVEQYLKSEEIPTEQGDVKVLVAKNFAELTKGKPALLEFYAPWCGHCKNLAPIYDKLGAKAAKEAPGLLIAKMDATANDVPTGYDVRGFPTIIFQNADGTRETYQGGRELKDFVSFLKAKGVWKK